MPEVEEGTLGLLILHSQICGDGRLLKIVLSSQYTATLTTAKCVWQQAPFNTRAKTALA